MKECFCVGPQNGEPLCRCRMRNVRVKDGRYIETIDHGPVPDNRADIWWGPGPRPHRPRTLLDAACGDSYAWEIDHPHG